MHMHLAFCSPKGRFLAGCGFGDHRQDRSRTCGVSSGSLAMLAAIRRASSFGQIDNLKLEGAENFF